MNQPRDLPDMDLPWLDATGPSASMVVSTRVRLARNLANQTFWGHNTPAGRETILSTICDAAATMPSLSDARMFRLDQVTQGERQRLAERHLVSKELAGGPGGRVRSGAALLLGRDASAMINEEDHLRLQAFRSGFALGAAYDAAHQTDRELGVRVSFAFHPEFGYLTACPTNVGTGLRGSVLIHLPALVLTREITKVLQGLAQVGLTSRGLFGEGSEALGHLFQLSNQTTLGRTEPELLEHLSRMVVQVIDYEERARELLWRDARLAMQDRAWRAWAVAHHARTLSFEELMNLLSSVRLGAAWELFPSVSLHILNRLLVDAQPAHVARAAGVSLEADSIPEHRATLVRRLFEGVDRP